MKIKDKILSETSEEVKQRVRDTANKLVMKQEYDFLVITKEAMDDFAIGFMKWFYENAYLIEWLSNDHKREQLLKAYKKTL